MVKLNITLPDGFLDEEVRCGYTVTSEMKKVWAVQIDLLCKLDAVCKKHNLKYYVDSGTLLGAIRHKGYIPWDDDIDVVMMREDYDQLLKFSDEFEYPYFLQSTYTEKEYFMGHAKLRNSDTTGCILGDTDTEYNKGIFIDIFPIDNLPDSDEKYEKYKRNALKWRDWVGVSYYGFKTPDSIKGHIKKILTRIIGFTLPYKKAFKIFEKLCKKYDKIKTDRVSCFAFSLGKEKYIWKREWFESSYLVPFEFISVPVPNGYDGRLRKEYGDYTEMRHEPTMHTAVFFSADISYKEYLKEQ